MNKTLIAHLFILLVFNSYAQLNWQRINSPNENISSLATGSNAVYAGTYTYGVYQSANEGLNWNNISLGLPDSGINSIQAATDDKLFAGTGSHGLYQYSNGT